MESNNQSRRKKYMLRRYESNGKKPLKIFTDGSYLPASGKTSCSFLIPQESIYWHGKLFENTNNKAELEAAIRAFRFLKNNKEIMEDYDSVVLISDSEYMVNSFTIWCLAWSENNWGKIKNLKMILEIVKLCNYLSDEHKKIIYFKHVKSHSGVIGNEMADFLANLAHKRYLPKGESDIPNKLFKINKPLEEVYRDRNTIF